jgi:hypothetical protein
MTIREALRAKVYKLRLDCWNPTQYLEIEPASLSAIFGLRAWIHDHGGTIPIDLNLLSDDKNDWLRYE